VEIPVPQGYAGFIPGAVHFYFREFVNDDDSFKSPDEIRRGGSNINPYDIVQ
jgi:3-mercaptopyruvate sulfurtransferase SseA